MQASCVLVGALAGTVWSAAFTLARSPTCIRTCVWTCFILLNYPSMARRACSRCQKVYEADKDKDKDKDA